MPVCRPNNRLNVLEKFTAMAKENKRPERFIPMLIVAAVFTIGLLCRIATAQIVKPSCDLYSAGCDHSKNVVFKVRK